MKLHYIKILPGQEVIAALNDEFKKLNISSGAIVSLLGGIDECCVSNMSKDDAKKDILTEYHQPLEMSGTGEITNGEAHIHCTLSKEGDAAIHGHLRWAKVKTWYVLVHVLVDGLDSRPNRNFS